MAESNGENCYILGDFLVISGHSTAQMFAQGLREIVLFHLWFAAFYIIEIISF